MHTSTVHRWSATYASTVHRWSLIIHQSATQWHLSETDLALDVPDFLESTELQPVLQLPLLHKQSRIYKLD